MWPRGDVSHAILGAWFSGCGFWSAPIWKRTATRPTVRWHDERIHWIGADQAPAVRSDRTHRHQIGEWTVHALAGSTTVTVRGT
jgi:hypothetical protein